MRFPRPNGHPTALVFSADGRELAVGAAPPDPQLGSEILLWNVAEALSERGPPAVPAAKFVLSEPRLRSMVFAPDGQTIALGCNDGLIRLWRPIRVPTKPVAMSHAPDEAWAIAFSPDGKLLASAGDNARRPRCLKVWDSESGELRWAARARTQLASCVAFSPDGLFVASGGYDKAIKLWDAATGQPRATLNGHTAPLRCLAFSPDGRLLASGGKDAAVRVWEVPTGRVRHTLRGDKGAMRGVAFSPNGRRLVATDTEHMVRFWDVETGRDLQHYLGMSPIQCVAYAPDGKAVAWGMQNGMLNWLDLATGQMRPFAGKHPGEIRSLSFSADGRRIATAGSDGTVRLWDPLTMSELLALPAGSQPINSVAFSLTGDRLAAASHDGTIRTWHAPKDE